MLKAFQMAINCSVLKEPLFLRVKIGGIIDNEDQLHEVVLEVIQIAKSEGYRKLLLDLTEREFKLSSFAIFKSAAFIAENNTDANGKLAIFHRPEDYQNIHYFESVALNRRLNVNIFTELEHAEKWLLK
jgi:hypothetical protein